MPEDLRPARIFPPGELLKDELAARGWSQEDLAAVLDRPVQAVSEIINAKKQITPETSIALGEALGTSPEFWHNLEARYRQRLAERQTSDGAVARRARLFDLLPLREMAKRGWIRLAGSAEELEAEVLHYLKLESLKEPPALAASFRCANLRQPQLYAQLAWLRRVEQVGGAKSAAPFAPETLCRSLDDLLNLSSSAEGVREVPSALASMGVRLAIVRHLPRTYVDGAALWLEGGPVVALTLRYDRIDAFWFTLLHELAHLSANFQPGRAARPIIDQLYNNARDSDELADQRDECLEEEAAANQASADWLIPPDALARFVGQVSRSRSRACIEKFAQSIGRHPGIVLGRLQHDDLVPYSSLHSLLVRVSPYIREHIAA